LICLKRREGQAAQDDFLFPHQSLELPAMKFPFRARAFIALAPALLFLGGCASTASAPQPHGNAAGASAMGSNMESMDMQTMCERHKKMMAGKSPQEHQAMMQEHMKGMSPEMRQRMETMMKQCR
jgi:hypothetical protein